jgi:predicted RNA methylase
MDSIDNRRLRVSFRNLKCVTPIRYAQKCCDEIYKICGTRNLTVVDACGGNGGDAVAFAHMFHRVISVEKDPYEFDILRANIEAYRLDNVDLIQGSYVTHAKELDLEGDVLYLDPPWGKNYKRFWKMHLYLDNHNIIDLIDRTKIPFIVVKAPFNYRYGEMRSYLQRRGCRVWSRPVRNYFLIFIQKLKTSLSAHPEHPENETVQNRAAPQPLYAPPGIWIKPRNSDDVPS